MVRKTVHEWARELLEKGYSPHYVKQQLRRHGHRESIVDEVLREGEIPVPPAPKPARPAKPAKPSLLPVALVFLIILGALLYFVFSLQSQNLQLKENVSSLESQVSDLQTERDSLSAQVANQEEIIDRQEKNITNLSAALEAALNRICAYAAIELDPAYAIYDPTHQLFAFAVKNTGVVDIKLTSVEIFYWEITAESYPSDFLLIAGSSESDVINVTARPTRIRINTECEGVWASLDEPLGGWVAADLEERYTEVVSAVPE